MVVDHQMTVGVEVVVHVHQGPGVDMVQVHLEGEGAVGPQAGGGEEDLWTQIIDKVSKI